MWFVPTSWVIRVFGSFGSSLVQRPLWGPIRISLKRRTQHVAGPGIYNWTFGLFKNIDLQEKQKRIQLRIETFNLFNKVNLSNPDTNFDSATFGQILAAAPARQVQFGLKYLF